MHFTLELTQVEDSVGVVLPKEVLAALKLQEGDLVYLTESPTGFRITTHDPAFEQQMSASQKRP